MSSNDIEMITLGISTLKQWSGDDKDFCDNMLLICGPPYNAYPVRAVMVITHENVFAPAVGCWIVDSTSMHKQYMANFTIDLRQENVKLTERPSTQMILIR